MSEQPTDTLQVSTIISLVIRHGIGLVGGGLITSGAISESEIQAISGAVLTIGTLVWSAWQKYSTNKATTEKPL